MNPTKIQILKNDDIPILRKSEINEQADTFFNENCNNCSPPSFLRNILKNKFNVEIEPVRDWLKLTDTESCLSSNLKIVEIDWDIRYKDSNIKKFGIANIV